MHASTGIAVCFDSLLEMLAQVIYLPDFQFDFVMYTALII